MRLDVVLSVVQSDVDGLLVGPPYQDVTTVCIMVLKLQSLETKITVLISEVFLIQEENNMWQSRGESNIIPLVPHSKRCSTVLLLWVGLIRTV